VRLCLGLDLHYFLLSSWPRSAAHAMPSRQRSWTLLSAHSLRSTRPPGKPWWKRVLSGCITSSNPEEDDDDWPESSTLVSIGKRQRKAAYTPNYAQSSFAKSTTPIKYRDPDRAERVSGLYRSASTTEHLESGGLRNRGKGKHKSKSPPRPSSEGLLANR